MHHLKEIDGAAHTVILVQVENECGALGAVRDFSVMAQKQFDGPVPEALLAHLHKPAGTWQQVFGHDADEYFQAWSVARYVNAIAEAGKQEMPLPMYVNNWLKSPRGYPILTVAGEDYPSGGPTSNMLDVWKAAAPAIDILAPDIYVPNTERYRSVMHQFSRPDKPSPDSRDAWFRQLRRKPGQCKKFVSCHCAGAIGFAPFGLDSFAPLDRDGKPNNEQLGLAENFALLNPIADQLAVLQFTGKVQTAVEEPGIAQGELTFGDWSAQVSFPPAYGESADTSGLSSTAGLHMGRVLVAQLGANEFLVAGLDRPRGVSQDPRPPTRGRPNFVRVEQGDYRNGTWHVQRLWNGDETDAGLNFKSPGNVVRVTLGTF